MLIKRSCGLFSVVVGLAVGWAGVSARGEGPADTAPAAGAAGTLPTDASGRALNFDFETGTLADWTAEGPAFGNRAVEGDAVYKRRNDMHSRHTGRFWASSFELTGGDVVKGTLTSAPFQVTRPFASFLIGGGSLPGTYMELLRADDGKVVFRTSGDNVEDMERVVVDLKAQMGKTLRIRLVDDETEGWGHVNFDDFRLYDERPAAPPRRRPTAVDVYQHSGVSPEEAARAMTLPPGFKVALFAGEPDIVQPIAMAIDDRGRLWVAEAYSYPRIVPQDQAKDRILIFEDADGDGRFDTRKVFAEHLNLVSGLAVGFGGAWVGAAPNLMFIPDRNGDDVPDGPPQIVLDGWGHQDTHETLNTFTWGPDGWLYGCHGVFTHSKVGKPGTPQDQRVPINAGIWRYHPTRGTFEVFAEGTSNPWGIDFDANGQMLITACVIPHLYHMAQGGRYERQAGQPFNPYTYDDIKTIADHRHYVGANPHGGNGRSDSAGGGHAHAGAMIYQGGAWPAEYRGSLFMNNIHGARINRDVLKPAGSGFVGSHAPDFLLANDSWSQIVHIASGPDGGVYMIDWYDKNQCHHNEVDLHDRTNGRIFKITYGETKPFHQDLSRLGDEALVGLLGSPNAWFARHARRILQERGPSAGARALLEKRSKAADVRPEEALRLLWASRAVGGSNDRASIEKGLASSNPMVRAWTVQFACEWGTPEPAVLERFAELARDDSSPVVRLYLASAMQRVPPKDRWDVLEGLLGHSEDAADPNLPLMDWYAAEPLAALDARRAARLASSARVPRVEEFMARRIASLGTAEALAVAVDELGRAPGSARRLSWLAGLETGLLGQRQAAMPNGWPKIFQKLTRDANAQVRSRAMTLALTFGDPKARAALRGALTDAKSPLDFRREALAALLKARDASLPPTLRALATDPHLGGAALRGLAAFDDPATSAALIGIYARLAPPQRRDALNTLASRPAWARAMVDAVAAGKLPRADLTADLVRQVRNLKSAEIDAVLKRVWGTVHETTADRARTIAQFKRLLTSRPERAPDASLGRAVFARTCQQCHTLFGEGGKVGPDLTGSNRADLDYLLSNVLDPSALIGKDYQANTIATADGRVLTGIVRGEDKDTITLVTANETITLPKSDVEERKQSEQSMMPEDLWTPLSEHEIRSLVAYLASPAQVPLPAGAQAQAKPER